MGFASDYDEFIEEEKDRLLAEHRAEVDARWYQRVRQSDPIHVADSPQLAEEWARSEYAEYGVWGESNE